MKQLYNLDKLQPWQQSILLDESKFYTKAMHHALTVQEWNVLCRHHGFGDSFLVIAKNFARSQNRIRAVWWKAQRKLADVRRVALESAMPFHVHGIRSPEYPLTCTKCHSAIINIWLARERVLPWTKFEENERGQTNARIYLPPLEESKHGGRYNMNWSVTCGICRQCEEEMTKCTLTLESPR
jgi:hypothetical protein